MKIVIFANGDNSAITSLPSVICNADYIIAADGGIHNCLSNDIEPNCIIGDFDSIIKTELSISKKTQIIQLAEQNSTDMEKAIEHAKTLNPIQIDIFCSFGKRMDHSLGNIFILNNYVDLPIFMHDAYGTMYALNPGIKKFRRLKGTTVSIFTLSHIENIILEGFEFPLAEKLLKPSFFGVSNKISDNTASIKFDNGRLLVYQIKDEKNK